MGNNVETVGLQGLMEELRLKVPPPALRSQVGPIRRSFIHPTFTVEQYPRSYTPTGPTGHLKFALRYEPVDLRVYQALFKTMDAAPIEAWIREESTGVFARRAWYLFERLTGKTLDVPDSGPVAYADLLDSEIHMTGPVRRSRRHRVNDNLLGDFRYSPLIRRTEALRTWMDAGLDAEARALIDGCDPAILARAVHFLYAQETKSSFAIEGESPNPNRTARFVSVLANAAEFDPTDPRALVQLQNDIVDPRYAATGWRAIQNYVGRTRSDYREHIHYVCPKPGDVTGLMDGWMAMAGQLRESKVDPVSAAAAASFGFVLIHPFEDGNGRIHRFLIHHVLARSRFTPPSILFPVSAAMLRDRRAYDEVLEGFSKSIEPFVDYALDDDGCMTVRNETAWLYRYWDATPFAEYLYGCVAETLRRDLREEIGFLHRFDAAVRATMEIVDMPDRRASMLVRFILQNHGKLSKAKRGDFAELTDDEVERIEGAVQGAGSPPG